jgi:alpha-tubulin suppressor-like RCC1 family protein
VYHVDCGVKHAALATKNGEVFTWGEDSGGRLGHGTREDSVHPRLVESLTVSNVDFVAHGEMELTMSDFLDTAMM